MKAQQRHQLKQNEFVATVQTVSTWLSENRGPVVRIGGAILVVIAIAGGYWLWRKHTNDQAGSWLGIAMAIYEAPVVPPPSVAGAKQPPNTYPTERARSEAALAAFQEVENRYPSSSAALAARSESGSILLTLGRFDEAEKTYQGIVSDAPNSLYAPAARMGIAEAESGQKQFDKAISMLTDLAAQRDGALPVDGVLMELARTCLKAGKTQDAKAAFKRVVDEFQQSPYTTEAQQQLTKLG